MGRPRKANVRRDRRGKSRGDPHIVHPEAIAVRERQLQADGVALQRQLRTGAVVLQWRDMRGGYPLGRLLLRREQGDMVASVSPPQHDAGEAWAIIVRRHALIMGYGLGLKAMLLEPVMGRSTSDVPPDVVAEVRQKYTACYDALMRECRDHGLRVRDVCYGICVEWWPLSQLRQRDYGLLRLGLNAIGRALG